MVVNLRAEFQHVLFGTYGISVGLQLQIFRSSGLLFERDD